MKNKTIRNLTVAAMLLALCFVLPLITGHVPKVGNMLSPMHIPVLLCGFVCGWQYGLVLGFLAPLLRSLLVGMPPMFPNAVAMAFELAAYGALTGVFYRLLPKKIPYIYLSLVLSMLLGRVVWGAARWTLAGVAQTEFPFSAFLSGAFTTAAPGIVLHLLLIPPIVIALRKAKLME